MILPCCVAHGNCRPSGCQEQSGDEPALKLSFKAHHRDVHLYVMFDDVLINPNDFTIHLLHCERNHLHILGSVRFLLLSKHLTGYVTTTWIRCGLV